MTATKPTDPTSNSQQEPEKLGLSATQLIASGLAAMSATVAASYFGVAGTVIGAALASIVTVVGNAVYGYSLRHTRNRVRRTLDVAVAHRFATDPERVIAQTERAAVDPADADRHQSAADGSDADNPGGQRWWQLRQWRPKRLALAAAGLFAAVLAVTTGFELASGQPLSSTVTGKHGSGVSIGGGSSKKASQSPTESVAPASTSSPSGTGIDTGTGGPTVTVTVTPSGSATPTQSSAPPTDSAGGTPSNGPTSSGSASPRG
jgi:hypothetical protein